MRYCHESFKATAFLKTPNQVTIDGWDFQFLSYSLPENINKVPIVFLGGAFQNFISFKKEVKMLMQEHPIILLDLPSQGSNSQLSAHLDFDDFAFLLKSFMDFFQIEKITPISLSYGSAIGLCFASRFPGRVDKLIIGGTTPRIRPSIHHLLQSTFEVMDSGDMDTFAQGVVLNLVNYSKRNITKISPTILKAFRRNMVKLNENEKQRYKQNTQRLLNFKGMTGRPECPTLVFTGEYDNFTTPYENAVVASELRNCQFALIKEGDHLSSLSKRDVMIDLYRCFLQGDDVGSVSGVRKHDPQIYVQQNRRMDERRHPSRKETKVVLADEQEIFCELEDISSGGCQIRFREDDQGLISKKGPFDLHLAKDLSMSVFPLNSSRQQFHCIFRKGCFEQNQKLEKYLRALPS